MSHRTLFTALAGVALAAAATTATLVSSGATPRDAERRYAAGGKIKRLSGDCIKLKDGRQVEFAGIRLPYDHEPNAEHSRRVLAKWLEDEGVRLQFDELREHRKDRILAYVYANDTFINERLVRDGLAFVKARTGNRLHSELLLNAQNAAREEKKGIWGTLSLSDSGVFIVDVPGASIHRRNCDSLPKEKTGLIEQNGTADAISKGMAPCGKCRPLDGAGI